MGEFTRQFMRTLPTPEKAAWIPRGKSICKTLNKHHWGRCEEFVNSAAGDGAGRWREYLGCLRCGARDETPRRVRR